MFRLALFALAVTPTLAVAQSLASTGAPPTNAALAGRPEARIASAVRVTTTPVLDGRVDENVCAQGQKIDQFLEYEPTEGAETRFKTEVCVAYDDKYFYVLARMFDPAPDSIVSLLSRRDVRTQSEQLKLVIDSYNDKRTAYQFAVNPAGVKRDFYVYNDNVEDPSWDAVWDVATAVDSLGWVAEFRIPFSQLRFASKPSHTFGLMIVRDVARTSARISWPLFYRSKQGYVSQAGQVDGITNIPSPRRLEVSPYFVAKSVTNEAEDVSGRTTYHHPTLGSYGADIKYGLSSNVTLDATINPDFGQVEADPARLNLTAFETFFEERRPFFLEGTGIFSSRVFCPDVGEWGCRGLFYSRRIGRFPDRGGASGDPLATTILGATKLTGRLGSGLSVGVLDAVTQREIGSDGLTIEPQTNYAVARLRQDLNNGKSDLGLMVTAVNRDLDDAMRPRLAREAYAIAVDGRHRFWNNYEVTAVVSGSMLQGDPEAIARVQRSGVHFYQRPDDDVAYDPTLERLRGDAQRISMAKFGGGLTRFESVLQRYSAGYELNDLGWLTRADEIMFRNWFALQFTNPNNYWRRANFNFNWWRYWSAEGLPTREGVNTNWHVQLKNQWWAHWGITVSDFAGRTFDDRDARGGPAIRSDASYDTWGGLEGDQRWKVTPYLWGGTWRNNEGRSRGYYLDPEIGYRISTRFSGSLYFGYSWQHEDDQWWANFGVAGTDTVHHTFAELEQSTFNVTTRINFTATPNLSFQFYAQPYISKGTYANLRELSDDPRSASYVARFKPFVYDCDGRSPADAAFITACDPGGIDFKQLNTNAVVRWEYRPGSTIFFVWQQGRFRNVNRASNFDAREDYEDLLGIHPNNTFLIKASYWFNY